MRILYFFTLLSFLALGATAQVRHVKGIQSVEVGYSLSETSGVFSADVSKLFSDRFQVKVGASFEQGESRYPYRSFSANGLGSFTLFKVGEVFYFNACGGLTLAYYTNRGESLTVKDNAFKVGFIGGAEVEVFLFRNTFLLLNTKQIAFTAAEFGRYRFFYGFGLKYSFL